MVQVDAAAQPAISVITPAKALHLAGRAHAIDGGPQPQRHQDGRIDGRGTRTAAHRFDLCIQRPQIKLLHKGPGAAGRMIGRQRGIEIKGAQLDLMALRGEQTHLAWRGHRCIEGSRLHWRSRQLEERRLRCALQLGFVRR